MLCPFNAKTGLPGAFTLLIQPEWQIVSCMLTEALLFLYIYLPPEGASGAYFQERGISFAIAYFSRYIHCYIWRSYKAFIELELNPLQ